MKIVVTGGRRYGIPPEWTGRPSPFVWRQVGGETVEEENPAYIAACMKAGAENATLRRVLNNWLGDHAGYDLVLAHGGASGADTLAGRWAEENEIPVTVFEADWKGHGKSAGPVRNRRMLEEFRPDFVIAFPGGAGTENCVRFAHQRGILVVRVRGER